ncbi:DNA/RNA non-specific endonuclease [Corallococcus sp. AS-1-6]|uniref:DNA/RNA non-specific endonuclease n=1 Tax=Corallococcus sp. AS-1-6 TaxID=2874599 RepID=UPI001CBBB908|nr:DNA/RNA non-specific endonuclease [Corallococcus sp. AS-1-6]MBZ4373818.1 DNA/RNA non-specific endonuclease [Corallococcus sp. AS-1-6]
MEKPPAALAQRRGTPQGPATVKTETQFNAQGLPTKQVKTTEIHTPGFKANDVSAFEAGQDSALRNASKGEDHHRTNNAPTTLKPGESSLTITEETCFNAQGEPAVSTRKTESVATQALKSDKNGNGVQVVRTQQEVTRGPKDSASTDTLPALTPKTPGAVNQRTTVTGYDPDGSHFDGGDASRSRTVTQSSGTVDAHGQMQLKHRPTEVQSLHEASDNRWRYDHLGFDVGADGKRVPGQEPRRIDKERQLPWYEDAKDFATDELKALADTADDIADAASDFVTAPLQEALTDEIKKLNSAGDSVSLSGNLDVKVGLKGGISGEAAIERTEDGKYQLSAEVTADVGVGLLGSASVGAGGRMEWNFDTPEEAAKAALTLGKGPSALTPGSEDHAFLRDHLSAMEVNVTGEVEAGIGGKAGTGTAELSASLGATGGLRVEFDKGRPTHLVKTVEFEGSGAAGVATGLKGKADLGLGGEVSGSVSIETKTPLDASKLDGNDVLSFLTGAKSDALVGPSEASITVEGSADRGNQGQYFTAEVSGLSDKEVQSVADTLKAGKFENAFDDLRKDAKVTQGTFKDRELGVGAKLGVVDFELSARHRDVTAEGGGGGDGSTTVSLGGGKRRGGSDGPLGGNGLTGGPNRSTGNEATGGTGPSSKKPGNTSTGGDGQPGSKEGEKSSAKLPGDTTADREPPNVYRVNPSTGRLGPVPPQDGGPSRAGKSEKPGAPGPGAEGRPPHTEEQGEKSSTSGRHPVPVVRNPELPGRTTHVRYDDGKVRIEAGPDATDKDIQAHMETARVLQRYEGAVGKVRQLIDKVKQVLTGMPGYGSQGFESRLEVKKLSSILQDLEAARAQLDEGITGTTAKATPATAAQLADLEKQVSSVESQLRTHAAQVDSLVSGRGYVAREDDVAPVGDQDGRLPRDVPSWVSGILPPHISPKDVVSQEGGIPTVPKPNKAYWDGTTLHVTDPLGHVESVVNRDRIDALRNGVPAWVARALPPHINPNDIKIENSKVTNGARLNGNLRRPKENTAYWVDGRYLYVTDSRGRVASVEGDLYLVGKQVRSESTQGLAGRAYHFNENGRRAPVVFKREVDGKTVRRHLKYRHDEGGHLIGAQFGGPPEFLNYVPQTRYQNGSVTNLPWDPRRRGEAQSDEEGDEGVVAPEDASASEDGEALRNWHEFEMHLADHLREGGAVRVRIRPQFISAAENRPDAIRVDGVLMTPNGEVVRGDWNFHNSARMDEFKRD